MRSPPMSIANSNATRNATPSCTGDRKRSAISAWCRPAPASVTRSISNTSPRPSGRARTAAARWPIPTRWSEPTATPRWSTGSRCLGWGVGGIEAEAAMLGQPISMLLPEVIGFRLEGKLRRRNHRDRSRAHRHPDAARARGGRQVRRVLRPRPRRTHPRRPGDDRQHGAGIRRHLRLLPDRRGDVRLSAADRPRRRADRPGRGLCAGAGALARGGFARSRVHRHPHSRPRHRHPVARRSQAAAGQGGAFRGRQRLRIRARRSRRIGPRAEGRGNRFLGRGRPCGDRRDHQLHQHVEPLGDGRLRPRRPQGARAGAEGETLGQDVAARRGARW